eukprot:TRINITY_DN38400_c0_g1_i1.p1 TRINITY_DN38400_c0_g1~~TRINITY_DN38400_c0_g1_i1.p1  ORF type:complete len:199 (+),score=29.67 TRINITY_DN38400_c0_g1_i1:57-653(+)
MSALGVDELSHALSCYAKRADGRQAQLIAEFLRACQYDAFFPARGLGDAGCIQVVDNQAELARCRSVLCQSRVVGVDIERHNLQSYKGYTCLIQLSSAVNSGVVFLVDCLSLSNEDLRIALADIFESSGILKIFHAATNDLAWLSQDFGFHVTTFLDTQVYLASFVRLVLCSQGPFQPGRCSSQDRRTFCSSKAPVVS